jgi:electron transfer flavoprotein beta subunit
MEIIVCIARVPDVAESEIEIGPGGRLVEDDLVYDINEWDNFAVEAALQLRERFDGNVLAITVGDEEDEDVLRRALAMGADEALRLDDPAFVGSDAEGVARILHGAISARSADLVLLGAVTSDGGSGQTGGMLAGLLGVPHVSLATALEVVEAGVARVRHEVEGGLERIVDLDLPAVVTVQTGINEPRYVSIRGIRKVRSVEIPVLDAAAIGIDGATVGASGARVVTEELFVPPRGEGAEILEGDDEDRVATLVQRLRAQGVL